MARLHEYQGKELLCKHGVQVPNGIAVTSPAAAREAAATIGAPVFLKIQAWVTGRKDRGGVLVAETPEDAERKAAQLLGMRIGNFPVTEVLVEERLDIRAEFFVSITIDDAARAPVLLLGGHGGTGIESRADAIERVPIDVAEGVDEAQLERAIARSAVDGAEQVQLVEAIGRIVDLARTCEARSLEVNPLVITGDGRVVAADCRMTIDDYAVFRHPELGIEIARELDHPATDLERIAYKVEQSDHRGTFYFAQLPIDCAESSRGLIGFHGAGGGGSMMSMDAATNEGFTLANFCDTSGNPSAAKVYRAARIILSQPNLVGYFGSGSGVASQEQFWSAYGLAKAFIEMKLCVPAVVRLGGNSEDRAVEILQDACRDLPGRVEGYKKDDTPSFCADRFAGLVAEAARTSAHASRSVPAFVGDPEAMSIEITGGHVWLDLARCDAETSAVVAEASEGLFAVDASGRPALAVDEETVTTKDSELIACEIECLRRGKPVVFVDLDIPGLEEAVIP